MVINQLWPIFFNFCLVWAQWNVFWKKIYWEKRMAKSSWNEPPFASCNKSMQKYLDARLENDLSPSFKIRMRETNKLEQVEHNHVATCEPKIHIKSNCFVFLCHSGVHCWQLNLASPASAPWTPWGSLPEKFHKWCVFRWCIHTNLNLTSKNQGTPVLVHPPKILGIWSNGTLMKGNDRIIFHNLSLDWWDVQQANDQNHKELLKLEA